jgi:serine/threonine protein kinase
MEYVPCGSLEAQIKKGMIPSHKIWKYFRGLILGIDYCHEKAGVVHRDIKPENLLIDVNDNIKIADFGISFMMDYNLSDEISVMAGSHFFMAPEVVGQERYKGKPSDIWAMGVTLYYMLCRKLPFGGNSIPSLYNSIMKSEPSYDVFFTTEQSNLLRRMMCKDPDNRITLKEIKVRG